MMAQYLHALDYKDYIVTHYMTDDTKEFVMRWTEKLGPIDVITDDGPDNVFSLGDCDGIFVASKKHSIILELDV